MKLILSITTLVFLFFSIVGISPLKMTKLIFGLEEDAMTCRQRQQPESADAFIRSLKLKGYSTNRIMDVLLKNGYYSVVFSKPLMSNGTFPNGKPYIIHVNLFGDSYLYCLIANKFYYNRSVISFGIDRNLNIVSPF